MAKTQCPAGGPRCPSQTRDLRLATGPMGVKVGYYTCPSCGWVSSPFTVPKTSTVPAK